MGSSASQVDRSASAEQRTKEIDRELDKERTEHQRDVKLLLLGAGESGKSTIVKQMQILHRNGFSGEDLVEFKARIYQNTLDAMSTIVSAMRSLGITHDREEILADAELIQDLIVGQIDGSDRKRFSQPVLAALKRLWADGGVRECFSRANEYQLDDSAGYLLDSLDRIGADGFEPTEQDALRTRVSTTGVDEIEFRHREINLRLIDVGGQRSERRKWIHYFDNVDSILFVTALSAYDQVLREDGVTNRMRESLKLFNAIRHTDYFLSTPIIIFLNKRDRFADKIESSPLTICFPEYTGAQTYEQASQYISERFGEINRSAGTPSYTHLTCATDTENVKVVFDASVDVIIEQNMKLAGTV